MAKVTFLLGLCGSGKSYYARCLKLEHPEKEIFQDLIHENAIPRLIQSLSNGTDCIVEEFRYCFQGERDQIVQRLSSIVGIEIEWFCLENDLESANWNVQHRDDARNIAEHIDLNCRISPVYEYPAGAKIIPITRVKCGCH